MGGVEVLRGFLRGVLGEDHFGERGVLRGFWGMESSKGVLRFLEVHGDSPVFQRFWRRGVLRWLREYSGGTGWLGVLRGGEYWRGLRVNVCPQNTQCLLTFNSPAQNLILLIL